MSILHSAPTTIAVRTRTATCSLSAVVIPQRPSVSTGRATLARRSHIKLHAKSNGQWNQGVKDVKRGGQELAEGAGQAFEGSDEGIREGADDAKSSARQAGRDVKSSAREAGDEADKRLGQKGRQAKGEVEQEAKDPSEQAAVVAEFSASALFTFLSCVAAATASQLGQTAVQTSLMLMGAHLVILPLVIYIFAPVSGAHFNPIITFASVVAGKQSSASGAAYITAQCLGAVLGASLALNTLPSTLQNVSMAGVFAIPARSSVTNAFIAEAVGSALFILAVLRTIVDGAWGKLGPFSVPLVITLLQWLLGPISSGCINPARAFGPAIISGFWEHHWVFWAAAAVGGGLASLLYSRFLTPRTA